jgi:hypothetical protein
MTLGLLDTEVNVPRLRWGSGRFGHTWAIGGDSGQGGERRKASLGPARVVP